MSQQPMPSLVQIMAFRLFDAKPLFKPMLIYYQGTNVSEIQNKRIVIQENAFEKVVCEMAAIWSRPQCIDVSFCSGFYVQIPIWTRLFLSVLAVCNITYPSVSSISQPLKGDPCDNTPLVSIPYGNGLFFSNTWHSRLRELSCINRSKGPRSSHILIM